MESGSDLNVGVTASRLEPTAIKSTEDCPLRFHRSPTKKFDGVFGVGRDFSARDVCIMSVSRWTVDLVCL